jgi:hypothetical protein
MTSYKTDYDLPQWWHDDDVTDQDRSDWFTQERSRRMAERQTMARTDKVREREERKMEAHPDTVDLEKMR